MNVDKGLLLFVVPDADKGKILQQLQNLRNNDPKRHLFASHILETCGWGELLDALLVAVEKDDQSCAEAIRSLQRLCDTRRQKMFVQFDQDDFTPKTGCLVQSLGIVIEQTVSTLERWDEPDVWVVKKWSGGPGWFGRNLTLRGYDCWLGCSGLNWCKSGGPNTPTPLWLYFGGTDSDIREVKEALRDLCKHNPCGCSVLVFTDLGPSEYEPNISVGICLKLDAVLDGVVSHVIDQLKKIADALA